MSNKIPFTPEFGATLLSKNATDSQFAELKANPADFVKSNYDVDLGAEMQTVENSSDTINLTLPYYSQLDKATADATSDDKLDSVSGGEIVISLGVILSGAVFWGGSAAGIVAAEKAGRGENIDGTKK